MPTDLQVLRERFDQYQQLHRSAAEQAQGLGFLRRGLTQSWLGEVRIQLISLERMIVQMENSGATDQADKAWGLLKNVVASMSPAVAAPPPNGGEGGANPLIPASVKPVAGRLLLVLAFLFLQLAAAIALLWYVTGLFMANDPLVSMTRDQWNERVAAHVEVTFYADLAKTAAQNAGRVDSLCSRPPATPPKAVKDSTAACIKAVRASDPEGLRSSVETLAATLNAMRMADADRELSSRYLDQVLVAIDDGDASLASQRLTGLREALSPKPDEKPASFVFLIILGSVLGMLTITIHLNWKFRNRWDTLGFLPWYLTRLVAAPLLSLTALALLSRVTFASDLKSISDFTDLGLKGANPLTIFAVAVISGLSSNRVYDWLRRLVKASDDSGPRRPPGAPGDAAGGGAAPANDDG